MSRVLVLALLVGACASDGNSFVAEAPRGEPPPSAVVDACDLARTRCSRCHTPERIQHASNTQPADWQRTVHRMRLMPGSAIRTDEESALVRCFVFRMSGNAGLARLSQETP